MSRGLLGIWPTLPPSQIASRRRGDLPFPLEEPSAWLVNRARQGLRSGLEMLGIGQRDAVLMPAYHHGSEVEAVIQAGAEPRFYAGTDRLEPDENELESLLDPHVRALHLTHYLGFPQDVARWRKWCSDRDLYLIEDAAQAWLSASGDIPLGSTGDLSVFCLYKAVPVADGAAVRCPGHRPETLETSSHGTVPAIKVIARWGAERGLIPRRLANRRGAEFDPAVEFGLEAVDHAPSKATQILLGRLDHSKVRNNRRRNFGQLLEALGEWVPKPFDSLPDGTSPWFVPITSEDKARTLWRLREAGINGLDFWSEPHPTLDSGRFPDASRRRWTTIGLPVHQGLRNRDVEQIAEAVRAVLA